MFYSFLMVRSWHGSRGEANVGNFKRHCIRLFLRPVFSRCVLLRSTWLQCRHRLTRICRNQYYLMFLLFFRLPHYIPRSLRSLQLYSITLIWRIKSPSRRTDIKHSNECVRFVVRRCQYSSYLCCKLEAWIVAIANSLDDILPLDLELNASLRSNIFFSRIGLAFTIFYLTCCTYFMDIV